MAPGPEGGRVISSPFVADERLFDREAEQETPDPPIQLIAFSLREDVPMVAVGYGNLDTASHTTVQAGGMGNDAQDGLSGWDTASRNLYRSQTSLLDRGRGENPAVVAWLGYDAPDALPSLGVLGSDAANKGAARLSAELDELWDPPAIMKLCAKWRGLSDRECYEVFNGGQGELVVFPRGEVAFFLTLAQSHGIEAKVCGCIFKTHEGRPPRLIVYSK